MRIPRGEKRVGNELLLKFGIRVGFLRDRDRHLSSVVRVCGDRARKPAPGSLQRHRPSQCRLVAAAAAGLRQEVTAYNIRTTIISPGLVDTELPGTITDKVVATESRQRSREAGPAPACIKPRSSLSAVGMNGCLAATPGVRVVAGLGRAHPGSIGVFVTAAGFNL
jgi:hypothetical protein